MLSFTYVYFSESGLFNGLQPIQIRKSFLCHAVSKCNRRSFAFATLAMRFCNCEFEPANRMNCSTHSVFRKEIAVKNFPDALHGREFSLDAKRVARNVPEPFLSTLSRRLVTPVATESA